MHYNKLADDRNHLIELLRKNHVRLVHNLSYDKFEVNPGIYLLCFYHSEYAPDSSELDKDSYLRFQWRIKSGLGFELLTSLEEILDKITNVLFLEFVLFNFDFFICDKLKLNQLLGALEDYVAFASTS